MTFLSNEIISNVFTEERSRLYRFLGNQKRRAKSWLIFYTLVSIGYALLNIEQIVPYVFLNFQETLNAILFAWIITLVLFPFLWPFKAGDFFSENFKRGLDPRVWQYDGDWKVELAEDGKSVLTVTDSNLGGFAAPLVGWKDYEVTFDMRILNLEGGWIIRTSGLQDYVHQKLTPKKLVTFLRVTGAFPKAGELEHDLDIEDNTWYPIQILARGEWLTVYIEIDGDEKLIFQDRAFSDKAALTISIQGEIGTGFIQSTPQLVAPSFRTGSFGFRTHGEEKVQFRNVHAYRLA